jgi:hypothetical protein
MSAATARFSGEALRASLRRRLVQIEHGAHEPFGWSQADVELAGQLCTWLGAAHNIAVTLPTTGSAGLPEVDWSAVTLEQLGRAVAAAQDAPLSWADLRIAVRGRLTERDAQATPGRPALSSADARLLLELYEYLIGQHGAPVAGVPTEVGIAGEREVDWSRISAEELSRRVRRQRSDPWARLGAAGDGPRPGTGAHDARAGERGATVRDASSTPDDEPLSYATFAAQRAQRRSAAAQQLLKGRDDFRRQAGALREAHLATAQELLADRTMPRWVRAQALRHHRRTLRRELDDLALQRGEVLGGGRPWYEGLLERWRHERGDRRDYARVLEALYDDRRAAARAGAEHAAVEPDPVLIAIAGARRHRAGGALVSTQRSAAGTAELFWVCEDTGEVVVRTTDAVATEAAIVRAYQLAGPPLAFEGSASFQARCESIAARHGFELAHAAGVAPADARAGGAACAPSASTSAAGVSSHAAAGASERAAPLVDLADYGEAVALVAEQAGVDYVVALDPKHAVPMNPVYLMHTSMREGPFELVFVQTPGVEAISAIALPRGCVLAAAVGGETRVLLEIEDGRWRATFEVDAPSVERPEPAIGTGRSRGR